MSKRIFHTAAALAFAFTACGCTPHNVSYSADVRPILASYCAECHAPGKEGFEKSGFDVSTYDSLMKGGKFGPLIKPGDAFTSALNMLVEGRASSAIRMPHNRGKLNDRETETLKVWVNEGAKNN